MGHGVGLTVTLRVRISSHEAHSAGDLCDGARVLQLFGDVATELLIRLDGDEGIFRAYEAVEFLTPVRVGDYLEVTGVITQVGATSRAMAFEARKVIANARSPELARSAADALADPVIVCRALGTCMVPTERQRRPRLVLPSLSGAPPEHASLPEPRPVITPPPRVIVTPPNSALRLTAAVAIAAPGAARDPSSSAAFTTARAIADEAARCRDAGAAIVHLRALRPLSDELVAQAVDAIRQKTDVIVQTSTDGSFDDASVEVRAALLLSRPEMATLTCGTYNDGDAIRPSPRPLIRALAKRIRDARSVIALACYDVGHIDEALALVREGHVDGADHFQFVLGIPGGIGAREDVLRFMTSQIPHGASWEVAAVGEHQRPMTELALRLGGHVRVGPENGDALPPEGSAGLVARAAEYARALGREVVDPGRARQLLGIAPLT